MQRCRILLLIKWLVLYGMSLAIAQLKLNEARL
jgi:hypothetical protein